MSPHQVLTALRRKLTARTALLAMSVVLCVMGIASSIAQSPEKEEREVEEKIPSHLPIKVKLRKPEKVKDIKNAEWLGDLEVEVTNTGTRPIYYLYIALLLPDVKTEDGKPIAYALRYGRVQLYEPQEPVHPDDVPLAPGESAILKVPADRAAAWKTFRGKGKLSNPKKLELWFQSLKFGDGTGYWTGDGIRYPKKKERGSKVTCGEGKSLFAKAVADRPPNGSAPSLMFLSLPTTFVPAAFLLKEHAPAENSTADDICCPGTGSGCSHLRLKLITCICGEVEASESAPCTDPHGSCSTTIDARDTCYDSTGFEHYCDRPIVAGPCGSPPPAPTPTPTPGPAPTPCDPNAPQPDGCYCDGYGNLRCCDPATRPNPYCDCSAANQPIGGGTPQWRCINCLGSGYREADFNQYPTTGGCPTNSYNDNHCCKCYNQNPTCPSGFAWDRTQCKCCNSSGQCTETVAGGSGCDNPPLPDGTCADGSYVDATGCCGGVWTCNPNCCQTSEECYNFGDPEPPPLTNTLNDSPSLAPNPNDDCCGSSPVLVDVSGDGFDLTGAQGGVRFDMRGDGRPAEMSWTRSGSDDSWLFLDRNGNGRVDDGKELFGNYTAQPRSVRPNGFRALAQFDKAERGGNGDGWIDSRDAVFASLRLWRDANHNGISEPGELHTLPSFQVVAFSLDYKTSLRRDRHGNRYRYRAPVRFDDGRRVAGRWAWDVFLVEAQ